MQTFSVLVNMKSRPEAEPAIFQPLSHYLYRTNQSSPNPTEIPTPKAVPTIRASTTNSYERCCESTGEVIHS